MTRDAWCRLGEGPFLTPEQQTRRVARVIERELTPRQRQLILGRYVQQKTVTQLAQELHVSKSTVSRTLQRGERRLRRCLQY